jgi:sec-independent protein translocase protein TatA
MAVHGSSPQSGDVTRSRHMIEDRDPEKECIVSLGLWEVLVILLIVLVIFGAGKLPQVMGDVAKGIKSFKAGLKDTDESSPPAQVTQEPGATGSDTAASHHAGREGRDDQAMTHSKRP